MSRRSVLLIALLTVACGDRAPLSERGQSKDRIINGISEPGHWYAVMVGDQNGGYCSGTLISRRVVVTAGHCYDPMDPPTRVFFDYGNPVSRSSVSANDGARHPGYDDNSLTNDLALVKLTVDAPVQAAPLLRETMNASFIGPRFAWVGYGDTSAQGGGFGTRRVVTFPINRIGPDNNIPVPGNAPPGASDSIDSTQFYFQVLNKNTCTGDSGGPAFVVRNGVERHAGVTSYGDEDCAYDGVAARTDAVTMTWIQQTIDLFEGSYGCKADGVCGAGCATTTPGPRGTLSDPDCADQHCAADGICSIACSPVDPDCSGLAINNCGANGVCQPGCATADVDCAGGTGGGSGGAGGSGGSGGAGGSGGSGGAGGSGGSGGTGGAGGTGGTGGAGGTGGTGGAGGTGGSGGTGGTGGSGSRTIRAIDPKLGAAPTGCSSVASAPLIFTALLLTRRKRR